jgi:hypothetical protein
MSCAQLGELARNWQGDGHEFAHMLRDRRIPHVSYSSVSTVEFCPARYYIQYVEGLVLDPEPAYYVKGRVLHKAASRAYMAKRDGTGVDHGHVSEVVSELDDEEARNHLENAVLVLLQNIPNGWEVVAVEQPFAMSVADDVPPCVGIIDLILRRGDEFAVIDHKTGRSFYDPDGFQMVIYREYIRREYAPKSCRAIFDQYRWVNNLWRIRKPAFRRVEVHVSASAWSAAQCRIAAAHAKMCDLQKGRGIDGTGECFRCPYRDLCACW